MDDHSSIDTSHTATPEDFYLCHPLRIQKFMTRFAEGYKEVLGVREWEIMEKAFHDDKFILANITGLVNERGMPNTSNVISWAANSPGSTELGGAMPMLAGLRHLVAPYRLFRLDDNLVELLNLTDVADDVPVEFLKLPYPRCFVELGLKRKTGLNVPNDATGLHALEGAYIEQGYHPDRGEGLYVMFTGSPLGKSHVMDDATQAIFLSLENPGRSIAEEMDDAYKVARGAAESAGLRLPVQYTEVAANMQLLCKALLYIGLPEVRKTVSLKHSELIKQIAGLKSPGKKAKAMRQLAKANDEIWVHAPAGQLLPNSDVSAGDSSGVTPHWRRGHYRHQRHGAKNGLIKLVFIAPTLVNAALAEDEGVAVAPKTYRVS